MANGVDKNREKLVGQVLGFSSRGNESGNLAHIARRQPIRIQTSKDTENILVDFVGKPWPVGSRDPRDDVGKRGVRLRLGERNLFQS
ncbi:hypothetical protein [Corynebacterium parakroppenstedtii]|uniref:hypothetical protein n=1 Tax=Corynebacterium parakroppenstedtii TaxID=2828363 RepID=UPI002155AC16